MSILITGGAGYIGSHMAYRLLDAGEDIVVLDNLSTGVEKNLPRNIAFARGDIADQALVSRLIETHNVDSVIHFAGSVVVPESVEKPLDYYSNNTAASRTLIEACVRHRVPNFLFSSTAAVYGTPPVIPVSEDSPAARPLPYHFRNSYGKAALPFLNQAVNEAKGRFTREHAEKELGILEKSK